MRSINDEYLIKNKNNIRDFIERLNENEFFDIFLGIRKDKLDLYYKGYLLVNFELKKDDFVINIRDKFKGEKDDVLNEKINTIISNMPLYRDYDSHLKKYRDAKTYKERVQLNEKKLVIKEKNNYYINLKDFHNYSRKTAFSYLLTELKKVLDQKYINNGERQIQNLYVCNYNYKKNKDLYIVDMEFASDKDLTKDIPNLHGRYDMIALKQNDDGYYVAFIELKSKKGAFKNNSGINDHIDDMNEFLSEYNKENSKVKKYIKNTIEKIITQKKELKILDFDINKIDYDNPEFWLLFDMVDNITINSKDDIEKIMGEKMKNMISSKLRLFVGNNGEIRDEIVNE